MRIVITGAAGFIGAHLAQRLRDMGHDDVVGLTRASTSPQVDAALRDADFVFHLAGVNRPKEEAEFAFGNSDLTERLVARLQAGGRAVPVVFASSTQAELDNAYGRSKRAAEDWVNRYRSESGAPAHVFRLTNVFGPGARPNYNSAVATFCHQVAHSLPLTIHNPAAPLSLVYVDDVVSAFVASLNASGTGSDFATVAPIYATTVGEVAQLLQGFAKDRGQPVISEVDGGLARALYATFLSYRPQGLHQASTS